MNLMIHHILYTLVKQIGQEKIFSDFLMHFNRQKNQVYLTNYLFLEKMMSLFTKEPNQ